MTPIPPALIEITTSQEPRPPSGTLQDFARQLKRTPESLRPTPKEGLRPGDRVRLREINERVYGESLVVGGVIESLMGREIRVVLRISAQSANGRVTAEVTPPDGRVLRAYEPMSFNVELPGGIPGTTRLETESVNDLGGTILPGQERAKRKALRACMAFSAILPNRPEVGSQSVEVRLKNTCSTPIPADRTWFRLVLRGGGGVQTQRIERFQRDAGPGEEIGRSVIVPVPPSVLPSVSPYDELLDR